MYILPLYIPESSKGVNFQPLGLFLVVQGLKFHTFGGFRYIYIYTLPKTSSLPPDNGPSQKDCLPTTFFAGVVLLLGG